VYILSVRLAGNPDKCVDGLENLINSQESFRSAALSSFCGPHYVPPGSEGAKKKDDLC
jgi:hypothetical protein